MLNEYTIIDPADGLEELTGLTPSDPNSGPHGKDEEGYDLRWNWPGPRPLTNIPRFKIPEHDEFNVWRDENTGTIYMDPKVGPHEFSIVYVHGFTSLA